MAAILRASSLLLSSHGFTSSEAPKRLSVSFKPRCIRPIHSKITFPLKKSLQFRTFVPFSTTSGETAETAEAEETETEEDPVGEATNETSNGVIVDTDDKPASVLISVIDSYQEALVNDDKSKIAEIEAFILSIEDEKNSLLNKVTILSVELSTERERILRISADFDNFRKRTEREKLSLVENVQGEVVENLLPVLDNFERAKAQIKVETEGEEKINNSYQSIYKQFIEILTSLGVEAVETVGNPFDPLLHEAIMREDSTEYEEGIIIQEFRKGFKLGDRLLRPSMVKVSAGPGPAKPEETGPPVGSEGSGDAGEESSNEGEAL